jgi:hypothetical protein
MTGDQAIDKFGIATIGIEPKDYSLTADAFFNVVFKVTGDRGHRK